jgi:glutathione S-transferase
MNAMLSIIAGWTQEDFIKKAKNTGKAQLLTIPYSHFVELARWTWLLTNKSFEESWYMPGQHILPMLSLRVSGSKEYISSTSFVAKAGRDPSTISDQRAKAARSTAVPALVQPSGEVLTDSWAIANASGLQPLTDPAIRKMYDEELGPLARQFAYCYFLKPKHRKHWDDLLCYQQGWLWCFMYIFVGGFLHALMSKIFGLGREDLLSECEAKLDALFARIAHERLPKNSRYINGDKMSVEDVALCSLAGPILAPSKYCGSIFVRMFSAVEASDAPYREKIERYRKTEVGKYVMQFYEDHREVKMI